MRIATPPDLVLTLSFVPGFEDAAKGLMLALK